MKPRSTNPARTRAAPGAVWPLQDAKARFSELVRRARQVGPQRVSVHGRHAVVVIDAETYDRERNLRTGRRLVDLLAASPLGDILLERPLETGPVRDVDL